MPHSSVVTVKVAALVFICFNSFKSLLYNNDLSNSIYVGKLTNFLVIAHQIRGAGLIAEIPTSMNITIASCKIFGDDSSWHNLTSPYVTNTFGKMLNFGDTYVGQGFVTQGLSYLIEITGTSMRNN